MPLLLTKRSLILPFLLISEVFYNYRSLPSPRNLTLTLCNNSRLRPRVVYAPPPNSLTSTHAYPKLVDFALHLNTELLHLRHQLRLALRPRGGLPPVLRGRPNVTAGQALDAACGEAAQAALAVSGGEQACHTCGNIARIAHAYHVVSK